MSMDQIMAAGRLSAGLAKTAGFQFFMLSNPPHNPGVNLAAAHAGLCGAVQAKRRIMADHRGNDAIKTFSSAGAQRAFVYQTLNVLLNNR
jgi:hypothetical protein